MFNFGSYFEDALVELADLYSDELTLSQLMMTINYLTEYATWDAMAGKWHRDPKTLREHVTHGIDVLARGLK